MYIQQGNNKMGKYSLTVMGASCKCYSLVSLYAAFMLKDINISSLLPVISAAFITFICSPAFAEDYCERETKKQKKASIAPSLPFFFFIFPLANASSPQLSGRNVEYQERTCKLLTEKPLASPEDLNIENLFSLRQQCKPPRR